MNERLSEDLTMLTVKRDCIISLRFVLMSFGIEIHFGLWFVHQLRPSRNQKA